MALLTLYAVRARDGLWFRAKGRSGYGNSWVAELTQAKVYSRIGPARACCSFWASKHPDLGVPEIVELRVTEAVVLDETARVKKVVKNKAVRYARKAERIRLLRLKDAQHEYEAAMSKLKEAQGGATA